LLEAINLKFNIVTAISSSEEEELVAALLHSQGCNILYRALELSSLNRFLMDCSLEVVIIVSKDFMSSKELMSISNKYGKYRFIQIDTKSNNISSLVAEISKIGKSAARNKLLRRQNLTTVIGSPGAPGVSTIVNHLATKLSATIIAANHHNLRPKTISKVITTSVLNQQLNKINTDRVIIDGGSTILLTTILADRRINAHWLSECVSCSSDLLYTVNSDENGIYYLQNFIKDYINLIDPPRIIYILNKQRFDRMGQLIQRQFLELTAGCESIQIPYDLRAQRMITNTNKRLTFWSSDTFSKQINKIGVQLT
jgi:hypothetical protein